MNVSTFYGKGVSNGKDAAIHGMPWHPLNVKWEYLEFHEWLNGINRFHSSAPARFNVHVHS